MRFALAAVVLAGAARAAPDHVLYAQYEPLMQLARGAMLGSIRTSWEQGTAADAILEFDNPELSIFGKCAFKSTGKLPKTTLQLALSAVVRQAPDGRLSQQINDAQDGAALDGASAGPLVLVGQTTQPSRQSYWSASALAQLNYLLNTVPRTESGAISHRGDSRQYWADGVYMGFPFLSYYGVVNNNQTLVQAGYDQCRLYRDALILPGPSGNLWGHLYSDDAKQWWDKGLWATGNAWAAAGILRVAVIIQKSPFASTMQPQVDDLKSWVKEILDGVFPQLTADGLVPNYIGSNSTFGDAASSAALASVAYRAATLWPETFGRNYTTAAAKVRDAILTNIDPELGLLKPLVDPLSWSAIGSLSTEGQAFGLMLFAAWRDWFSAKTPSKVRCI